MCENLWLWIGKVVEAKPNQHIYGHPRDKGVCCTRVASEPACDYQADVYSFEILLLELICCRKCVDWNLPEKEAILEEWAYRYFEARKLDKLMSSKEVDKIQLERMVKVGLWCILGEPSLRSSMKKVLLMLEGTIDIPIPPSPTSFLSTV